MHLRKTVPAEISELTRISKAAFDTDILVGGREAGGPPDYDSASWHENMMICGNLYTAVDETGIAGGAVLFPDADKREIYIGRIFVDPVYFRKGYGIAIMERIENMYPGFCCKLDTPIWNVRTNRFYNKLGYQETGRDAEAVYYQKQVQPMILETERLILREMMPADFDPLYAVLADSDIMEHYPYTFDETRVRNWIARNQERYQKDGFGLWAVVLKETGEMIGDCGVTMQNINGQMLPEIGYHIRGDHQRRGYASEAAAACARWIFENRDFPAVYSYMKYTNIPSQKTAMKIGMKFAAEYEDPDNTYTRVYVIDRKEWEALGL